MAVILAISSQVAYGRVGLSAYSFALQCLGHEVICLPTVNWLTHPKLGKPIGDVINADKLADMGAELISLRLEEKIDWVMSGYLANEQQAASVKWIVTQLKSKNPDIQYCCDPVMGDAPKGLYVAENVATYIKIFLAPMADMITPNEFEAQYLGEMHNRYVLKKRSGKNIYSAHGIDIEQNFDAVDIHLNGAGDLFGALFLGYQLNGLTDKQALEKATSFMQKLAEYSLEHNCDQLPIVQLRELL